MNHFTVVMIALLIPATAMAAGECRQDRQKFCKGAAYIGACLDKHKAELTENCRAKREEMANAKKGSEEPAKMGKEEGAQPLTKESCKTAGMKWNEQSNVCGR